MNKMVAKRSFTTDEVDPWSQMVPCKQVKGFPLKPEIDEDCSLLHAALDVLV